MAQNWSEKRRKRVRCKAHGLHYDPELSSGCALCRKEGLLPPEPRERPQFVVLLLCLLTLAGIAYYMFGPYARADVDIGPRIEPPDLSPKGYQVRLDPERYRKPIEALEAGLLRSRTSDLQLLFSGIVFSARSLAAEIRDSEPEDLHSAAEELDRAVAPMAAGAHSLDELRALRQEWIRIRGRYFIRASWYSAPVDAGSDRAVLATYLTSIDQLTNLLHDARLEAEALADPTIPSYGTEADRAAEAGRNEDWKTYLDDLYFRIETLRKEMPKRPDAGAPAPLLMARQKLEQVFDQASSLARGGVLARGSASQGRFNQLLDMAEEARRAFDDVPL